MKRENEQLIDIFSKYRELSNDKTMRRVLQLKKENDDSEHVLNQIEKELNEELEDVEKEGRNLLE